jgi:putative transposase
MGKSYSSDLRERVVTAVVREGMSRRKAAARFGAGIKTATDWVRQYLETGRLSARPRGGNRPKKLVGEYRDCLPQRCVTQEQFAELSGSSQQYISSLESGRRNPTVGTLYELATALGVSHLELVRPR